jgi:hypothetical protein
MAEEAIADMRVKAENGFFKAKSRETVEASFYNPQLKARDPSSSIHMTQDEWLKYGLNAIDLFQLALEKRHIPDWKDILFRNEQEFIAGSFSCFHQIWLILISQVAPEDKAELYHTIFTGMSIFDNLKYVREASPITHRREKIGTRFITNPDNIPLARPSKKDSPFTKKYHRKVLHPVFADGPKKGSFLKLKNPKALFSLHPFVTKQLRKWTETGALELIDQEKRDHMVKIGEEWYKTFIPLLTSAIIAGM